MTVLKDLVVVSTRARLLRRGALLDQRDYGAIPLLGQLSGRGLGQPGDGLGHRGDGLHHQGDGIGRREGATGDRPPVFSE